jgi:GNAT superfamily N-acetyltransferase
VEQCRLFALDWADRPETLLFKMNSRTFEDYMVLLNEKDEVVCGAGFYRYTYTRSLLMSRMWTRPDYRAKWIGHQILRAQIRRMSTRYGMITFNEANKPLYDRMSTLYGTEGDTWPGLWRKFKPVGKQVVNYVEQYCLMVDKDELDLQRPPRVVHAGSSDGF